jgi:cholesterol oxidase
MSYKSFYTRRRFLQNAAMVSSGLATSLVTTSRAAAQEEFSEAIVIGSGFGGAVAALRLGQSGVDTLVIERGRRWPITAAQNTFATYQRPDGRSAWLSPTTQLPGFGEVPIDVFTGILERKDGNGISVFCGAGVGGGSLVYNGITLQPPRELFYKVFPDAVDYGELDQVYYPRVRSIIRPEPIPRDILETDFYGSTRLFLDQARAAELPHSLLDIAIDWNVVRQEISGARVPSAIVGEVWYGMNSGAKKSLDHNYLAQAEQTGRVNILPLHVVTDIFKNSGEGYRIICNQIDEFGRVLVTKTINCRYLFMGAGSMGTSELLVKAKAKGTLPQLNDDIGKGWGTNGDTFAIRSGFPMRTNTGGGPATATIRDFDNPLGPLSIELLPLSVLPDGIIPSIGIGLPTVRGHFRYNPRTDSADLVWPSGGGVGDANLLEASEFAFRLLDRKNATSTSQPQTAVSLGSFTQTKIRVAQQVLDTFPTFHPLGGAVIGKACDLYGRLKGYQGLYVVDGALMPGSTACANPSFTISAMAERCMERIITEDIRHNR